MCGNQSDMWGYHPRYFNKEAHHYPVGLGLVITYNNGKLHVYDETDSLPFNCTLISQSGYNWLKYLSISYVADVTL